MRKRNKKLKTFSRPKNQRVALFRTLASSLFLIGKIKTTEAKAKELRSIAEKYITRAKEANMASKRVLAKSLSLKVVAKLTDEIAPKYSDRSGGYTRVIKTIPRKSDSAKMAIIELI